jgi:hypothetical protein
MDTASPGLNPEDIAALDATTSVAVRTAAAKSRDWRADAASCISKHAVSSVLLAAVGGGVLMSLLLRAVRTIVRPQRSRPCCQTIERAAGRDRGGSP